MFPKNKFEGDQIEKHAQRKTRKTKKDTNFFNNEYRTKTRVSLLLKCNQDAHGISNGRQGPSALFLS